MRAVLQAFVAIAVLTGSAMAHAEEMTPITQETLLKRIEKKDPSLVVLDVRTPEEYKAGHIPGAINIPYTSLPARISEVSDAGDKDIVLYCAVGVRAEKGAERLKENGFKKLLHLDGDMQAWQEKNRPLEK